MVLASTGWSNGVCEAMFYYYLYSHLYTRIFT
jgi:hypothetical protein